MSQAEKLMHELTQNCGIDFNNTRRKLAVEIIERFVADEKAADLDPAFSSEALLDGEVGPAYGSLAAVPSVSETIAVSADIPPIVGGELPSGGRQTWDMSGLEGSLSKFVSGSQENPDASGQ